jgi:hypothetical protein
MVWSQYTFPLCCPCERDHQFYNSALHGEVGLGEALTDPCAEALHIGSNFLELLIAEPHGSDTLFLPPQGLQPLLALLASGT